MSGSGSGSQSLLKYRFQKKEPQVEKISNEECSSPVTVSSINSVGSPSNGSPSVISDSSSPVFPSKRAYNILRPSSPGLRKSLDLKPNSTAENGSCSSTSSSPWLSKETGNVTQNGVVHPAKVEPTPKETQHTVSNDDRDLHAKVSSLLEVFPGVARNLVEEALNFAGGDVDAATDHIIDQRQLLEEAATRKRKYVMYSSQDSGPVAPMTKKAKHISESEDDGSPKKQVVDFETSKQRTAILVQKFPAVPKHEIEKSLKENLFDIDKATVALSLYKPPPPPAPPVSQTKNVGSIKAFFANRAQAKVYNGVVTSESKAEPRSEPKKKVAQIIDSDSDSEMNIADELEKEVKSPNEPILDFFRNATVDELTQMNGCSRKKAEVILTMRPFEDWDDLVSKFENSKAVSYYLITECKEVIRIRNGVKSLMERCQRISTDLESFIATLTSKTTLNDDDRDLGYVVRQPSLISKGFKLTPYQMIGLNWLILMHEHNLNGILGDEMGLGKTIQTIAFFAHLLLEGDTGPHVVIAPSSTIDNWLRELKTWCPALKVLLYYGSQEERREIRNLVLDGEMDDFNIVVTSYNMASSSSEDRVLFKKFKYHYAVFDEGHMLKNMASMRYQSLMKISARRRLLLTGTPLQNNLLELMSLLSFVMPEIFAGRQDNFKKIFSSSAPKTGVNDSRGSYEKETLEHAKRILKPFFLRRLKSEVLQQLPAKSDSIVRLPLAFEQQDLYDELKSKFLQDVKNKDAEVKNKDSDNKNKNGDAKNKDVDSKSKDSDAKNQSGSAMMMQLRKAANHHLLHRRQFDDARLRQMSELMLQEPTHRNANAEFIFEDMQVMSDFELHSLCLKYESIEGYRLDDDQITDSGKFRYLDELLPTLKAKNDRVLLFSQFTMMLDIVEVYMRSRQHRYIRLDGQTPVAERQELIDQYTNDADIFIFLLSTKAGGLGINLTAANTVILHDIDFNPYNDKQAEDRCHRVGQCREVTIYRLISKNTIEEAMLRCAQAKLKLEKDVTGINKDDEEDDPNDVASLLKEALQDAATEES